jgi:hypothetical protein
VWNRGPLTAQSAHSTVGERRGEGPDSFQPDAWLPNMFRWPDRPIMVFVAYGLVFIGAPVLCVISYLWITGAF